MNHPTFLTRAVRGGWLHFKTSGNITEIRAQRTDYQAREFKSERRARRWLRGVL